MLINRNSALKPIDPSEVTPAILCEKGNYFTIDLLSILWYS